MKKVFLIFLTIFTLQCRAVAEEGAFQIEGEWFSASLYSERYYPVQQTEEEGYFIDFGDEEITLDVDGSVSESGKIIEVLSVVALNDGGALYYTIRDHALYGYIILNVNGEYRCYSVDAETLLLFIGGIIVPYQVGEQAGYLLSSDNLYITAEDNYIRGTIQHHSSVAFSYVMDADPVVIDFGNGYTQTWGIPSYLFIRSNIGQ